MPDQDLASKYMDLPQQGLASMAHTPPYAQPLGYQQAPTPGYNPPGYGFPPMYPQSSYPGYPMSSYLTSQCPSPSVDGQCPRPCSFRRCPSSGGAAPGCSSFLFARAGPSGRWHSPPPLGTLAPHAQRGRVGVGGG